MTEELITKKDLLKLTGISYGQLYRWKRKNVIPEEWFIKKSTFTGQETFFPKEKVLDRINKIMTMKEDLSLDDLADKFSAMPTDTLIYREYLEENNIIQSKTLEIYESIFGDVNEFKFEDVLCIYIFEDLLKSGDINLEEGKNLIELIKSNYNKILDKNYELILIRKFGTSLWIILECNGKFIIEADVKLVVKLSINKYIEELKLKTEQL